MIKEVFPEFRSKCQGHEDFEQAFKDLYNTLLSLIPQGIQVNAETGLPFYTGYSYKTLYDWDQYFEAILQFYCGFPTMYAVNGVKLFLRQQQDNGHIVRTVPEFWWSKRDHVKPFLCQIAFLCYLVDGHLDWLDDDSFLKLQKYLDHWLGNLSPRTDGFPVWDCAGHSGMDNHMERAGSYGDAYCEGVDLASYLVRETLAMSLVAQILGKDEEAEVFRNKHALLKTKIQGQMWNESDGILYDIDARSSTHIPVKHAGIFASLWAEAVDNHQASLMVENHLLNEKEFWRPYPVAALAATEEGYVEGFLPDDTQGCCSWRAHTWIPINYYITHGLVNYGFSDAADRLAKRAFEMFFYYPFHEYYTSENGIGTGLRPFWGWSPLAIFLPFETALGIDPTKLSLENDSFVRMRRIISGA